jgi:uncharacterized membrane protein
MDKAAEKLSEWFGSAPFILFHVVWFAGWVGAHYLLKFDSDWNLLTLIVSLEAIFLALFILRAENVQSSRQEKFIKKDLKKSDKVLEKLG